MAINNIVLPQKMSPAYNPLVFSFSGNNVTEAGYRYVVDVYEDGVVDKIASFRVVPQVDTTGYIDLSRVLSSQFTGDFNFSNTGATTPINTFIEYGVKIGEEYQTSWPYDDFEYYSNPGGIYDGYIKLTQTGSTEAHTFVVGDQINVITTLGYVNGLQTVVKIINNYNIIIGVVYDIGGPAASEGGTVLYADNRKTIFRDIVDNSGYVAYNGALSVTDYIDYDYTNFAIANSNSTTRRILTNMPDNFVVTPTQDLWLNFMYDTNSGVQQTVRFKNDSGDEFSRAIYTNPFLDPIRQVAAGPNNNFTLQTGSTILVSGTFPLIKEDTEWYEVYSRRSTGQSGKTYRVYLDKRCKNEDYEIVFMDRLGSFTSYAFQLRSVEAGTIVRNDYKKQLGDVVGDKWTYETYDAGTTNTSIQVTETLRLNTNWMNDDMSVYFNELLSSPLTYVKIDGVYISCTIADVAYQTTRQKNKNLIRKSITIKFSNNDPINI
jgi:hypothetical protein